MSLVVIPRQMSVDADGQPRVGAQWYFYAAGTDTLLTLYTTPAMDVEQANPVESLGNGYFPAVYIDAEANPTHKQVMLDADGLTVFTDDDILTAGFAHADIAALLYPEEVGETGVLNTLYRRGHVYRYGTNTTPGSTDMTTAFQNAGLSSLNPYAPADTYLVTGSIPVRDNQHWYLEGANIAITGSTQVFTATTVNDWSVMWRGGCAGDNDAAGATSGSGAAIKIVDCMRFTVSPPVAKNIKGSNLFIQPGSSTSSRAEHGLIDRVQAAACYRGLEVQAGTGAEYITIGMVNITRCAIGALIAAGNVGIGCGSITDNTTNIKVTNGSNHAHGIIANVNLNHASQYLVHCDNVTNGQTFANCHYYANDAAGAGAIFLDQCKGVQFLGGIMDCWVYNYKGASSGLNVIRNMFCPGAYGLKRAAGTNNGHDELLIFGCHGPGSFSVSGDALDAAGVSMNDAAFLHVVAKRVVGSTQSLTSGVAADLLFNTETFDRRGAYVPGTGITTIPAGQGGVYRITGDLVFVGTAMSVTASFVELKVGGTALRLYTPTIYTTTKLVFSINSQLYLNAADALKLTATITGTTPVHGDATYESGLSIERIA